MVLWKREEAGEAPCPVSVRDVDGKIASSPLSGVGRKECKSLRSLGWMSEAPSPSAPPSVLDWYQLDQGLPEGVVPQLHL